MSQQVGARHSAARSCRGWTLVEALVGLSIFGLLLAQAVPGMRHIVAKQRQEIVAAQLEAHLSMARSSALTRKQRITLSSVGPDWSQGWRLHVDENANGAWDEGEGVLARGDAVDGIAITAKGPMGRYVSYDIDGLPVQASGAFMAGTWHVCAIGSSRAKRLVLSATGRVRREEGPDPTCS